MKQMLLALFSPLLSGLLVLLILTAAQPVYALSSTYNVSAPDKIDWPSKSFVSARSMGASLAVDKIISAEDVTSTNNITPTDAVSSTGDITSTNNITSTNEITATDDITSTGSITSTNDVTSTDSVPGPGIAPTNGITATDKITSTDEITPTDSITPTGNITPTGSITPTGIITPTGGITSTNSATPIDDTPPPTPDLAEVTLVVSSPQTMTRRIGSILIDKAHVLTDSLIVIYPLVDGAAEIEPAGYECLEAGEQRLNWAVSLLTEKYAFTSTQYLVTLSYNDDPRYECVPASQRDYEVSVGYNKPIVSVVLLDPELPPTATPTPDNRPLPTNTPTPTPTSTPTPLPTPTPSPTPSPSPDAAATVTKLAWIVEATITARQPTPTPTYTPTDTETPKPTDTPMSAPPSNRSVTLEPTPTDTPNARAIKAEIALAVRETLTALPTPNALATSTAFAQAIYATLAVLEPTFTPTPPPLATATPNLQATADALSTAVIATITAQPTATPTPTFTATPTPITDYIQINDQVSNGTSVVVDEVIAVRDRWLIIYQMNQNDNVQIVGRTYVPTGKYANIKILFQRHVETGSLLNAMLHEDTGQIRVFDFPITDQPVKDDKGVVSDTFVLGSPLIRVSDQTGNNVIINSIVLTDSGWVVLYDQSEQKIVGKEFAPMGLTLDLVVAVTGLPEGVQRNVMAVVHSDGGKPHFFDFPGSDLPMANSSNANTQVSFNFTYSKQSPLSTAPQSPRIFATPTPTIAVPSLYSPPNQYAPPNLAPIDEDRVTFQWHWTGELPENWGFEVRGWLPKDPHNGIHDARLTAGIKPDEFGIYSLNLAIPDRFKGQIWYWTVAVVQLEPYKRIGLEAPPNIIVVPPVSD